MGVGKGQRKQIRCPLTPCCRLHETWEFDLRHLIRTAESLLILRWRSDWIPKGIIKGSFLQEVPHITLPPLNHICSAISSSSTCSNFALEKKSLCWASFLLLHFHPELTETSFSTSVLYWWWSTNWSSPCSCIFYNLLCDKLNRHPYLALVTVLNAESLVADYLPENWAFSGDDTDLSASFLCSRETSVQQRDRKTHIAGHDRRTNTFSDLFLGYVWRQDSDFRFRHWK